MTAPAQLGSNLINSPITKRAPSRHDTNSTIVRVEDVHVYPGGQAIVGNDSNHGGGWVPFGNSIQPHATGDTRAPVLTASSAMLCQDAEREAVPFT